MICLLIGLHVQVEPLMDQYRPPGISRIYFKKLTFGDAPFRVEGIRVDDSLSDRVQMDIDFRWAGDANIFLAVELPAGGGLTRMVPKVGREEGRGHVVYWGGGIACVELTACCGPSIDLGTEEMCASRLPSYTAAFQRTHAPHAKL